MKNFQVEIPWSLYKALSPNDLRIEVSIQNRSIQVFLDKFRTGLISLAFLGNSHRGAQ